jgi:CheY-like chemotaxis protein/anti-sigma regulatory factor (Ser/Thr protein kinase)
VLIEEVYSVAALVNDTVSLNIVRIGSKPIIFNLRIDQNIPVKLRGDELRLRQILNNLLSNAIKYTKEGRVDLEIKFSAAAEDEIELICEVKDTGIGIREEDLQKLFSVYNQVNTKVNRYIEGTGLGLSIVKNLVDMMGGSISVESAYGKGSIFTVRIPQKVADKNPIGIRTAQNLESFQFMSAGIERRKSGPRFLLPYAQVLVVDDVATNLDVARGMMLPYHLRIDCVTSGQEAVDRIKKAAVKYDAIFMDHMMPEMDGIMAVDIIRNQIDTEYARNVPIIALTANAIIGNEEMFLSSGFQDYLTKPIDMSKLDAILNKWVRNPEKEKTMPEEIKAETKQAPARESQSFAACSVEGLDVTEGLARFSNREATYIRILKSFVKSFPAMLEEVRKLQNQLVREDAELEPYTIKIHGIKGACRGIGANPLGKMAEELEMASRSGNRERITEKSPAFYDAAKTFLAALAQFVSTRQ